MAEQSSKVIDIRCARVKPARKRTTPASLREAWMRLYEELSPDERAEIALKLAAQQKRDRPPSI